MPADYGEVLRDLDAHISTLEAEIATLRAGRPTIVLLRNKYSSPFSISKVGVYAYVGPTGAIPLVLKGEDFPLTTAQVAEKLIAGGIKSNAQNFVASVSATLSQLKDKKIVRKIGDTWALEEPEQTSPASHPDYADAGISDDDIPF